jgi:hypothetical protein
VNKGAGKYKDVAGARTKTTMPWCGDTYRAWDGTQRLIAAGEQAKILAFGKSTYSHVHPGDAMIAKQTAVLASCALFTCLWGGSASAQDDVQAPAPAPAKQYRASANLTPEQLDAFADLTGDGQRTVAYRLSQNPNLVPLAASAADARASRRRTGKIMAIVGFTILGVGDLTSAYILATTPGYPKIGSGHENRVFLSAGMALGSIAVGLALAIPGLVKMASPTEVENEALDAYAPGRRDISYQSNPPQLLGKTVTAPVWSSTF